MQYLYKKPRVAKLQFFFVYKHVIYLRSLRSRVPDSCMVSSTYSVLLLLSLVRPYCTEYQRQNVEIVFEPYLLTYILTYLLTYLLHGAESFLRS